MQRTIHKSLLLSGILLVLGLLFMPLAAHAEPKCVDYFESANKEAAKNGKNLKPVSLLLTKAGTCCTADIEPLAAQKVANSIRSIVAVASSAVNKKGDKHEASKVMSAALNCAGQPSIVAVDPALYSSVLADSAQFAELARDENGTSTINQDVQFARQHGNRPSNNQQPTVSIEQK